ncbi:MAG: riboflavin synthase [Mariprofundaceae bacterium]|nr:riboflavin synthase [Mariprofundaceae bacterium]
MFTGMIQDVGRIVSVLRQAGGARMRISTQMDISAWVPGESVAVDGCCLTVTDMEADTFSATLSPETLTVTCFDTAREGQRVNLEPALRVGDSLGGHMVTGHVDGIGEVAEIREVDGHRAMSFRLPEALRRYVVIKGSVAVNGVSLTVNDVDETGCTVNLIPHTLAHTNLGDLKNGDRVNIETDILGRYVERLMQFQQEKP